MWALGSVGVGEGPCGSTVVCRFAFSGCDAGARGVFFGLLVFAVWLFEVSLTCATPLNRPF